MINAMKPTGRLDGLQIVKVDAMRGNRQGLQQKGKRVVYVAPEIYSLLQTDFDAVIASLRVRIVPPGSLDFRMSTPSEWMRGIFKCSLR